MGSRRGQMRLWGMFTFEELLEAWPEWFDLVAKVVQESQGRSEPSNVRQLRSAA